MHEIRFRENYNQAFAAVLEKNRTQTDSGIFNASDNNSTLNSRISFKEGFLKTIIFMNL